VVIPVYNGDRFIAEAINSILNQTEQDFELIVVNDGSTDQTERILQSYDRHICYFSQSNQGVAAARNRGLQVAQGEFVVFFDQDDVSLPEKLSLQVQCFETHPQVGMVHSGWRLVDADKQPLSDSEPWHEAPQLDAAAWLRRMPVLLSAMMFRRSWLQRINGFDTTFRQVCDVELVQRLVLAGCQTAWVRQVTVLYRQHDRNDSRNTVVQAEECWAIQEQFFRRIDLPMAIRQMEAECRYHTLIWIAWRLYHTNQLAAMARYLEIAFSYRPGTWTEAILEWVERFQRYEAEYGQTFDVERLTRSPDWQRLIQQFCGLVR
jgi:glycosyltransferase involved in cell wall biosynthesis